MNRSKAIVAFCMALATGCSLLGGAGTEGSAGPGFRETIGGCDPTPCVRIALDDPPALPDTLSPQLKELIVQDVRSLLYSPIESDEKQQSRDLLVAEVEERFKEFSQPGFSDAQIDWGITRTASVLFQNGEVITIDIRSEGYVGGAHGFKDRTLLAFDVASGKRLAIKDLIDPASEPLFRKLVEDQFRRAREIPPGESLADAGYFVRPGEPMPVPDNFGLTPGGLVIQYNPYEVAPYAYGATEIVVPLEAFQGVLAASLRGLVASLDKPSGPKA